MEISFHSEVFELSPLRALYWPRMQTLILADLHLGKTSYFQSRGIAIPSSVMEHDLNRLAQLIQKFQPKKLIIAGDMFHHKLNADIKKFAEWRKEFGDIEWLLVPGNHDKLLKIDYEDLNITVTDNEYKIQSLFIIHEALPDDSRPSISGHLHPGYLLKGNARQALKLPCFIISRNQIILPAFSMFTGLYTGYPTTSENNFYVIADNKIISVS